MSARNNKPENRNRTLGRARTATTQECAHCGMVQDEWGIPEGYKKGGEIYCCEGCALDTGCTCEFE